MKLKQLILIVLGAFIIVQFLFPVPNSAIINSFNLDNPSGDLYKKAAPSVFAIYLDKPSDEESVSGTGFAIRKNSETIIVTNEHVVSTDKKNYYLVDKKGKTHKAYVFYKNKEDDIAFLSFRSSVNVKPLPLENSTKETLIGSPVHTIGNPYDFLFSFSSGQVSNINRNIVFQNGEFDELLIQTTINVNPGNSGGPLLNDQGYVIGIVSSMLEDSFGMSFAVPTFVIEKHLSKIDTRIIEK